MGLANARKCLLLSSCKQLLIVVCCWHAYEEQKEGFLERAFIALEWSTAVPTPFLQFLQADEDVVDVCIYAPEMIEDPWPRV